MTEGRQAQGTQLRGVQVTKEGLGRLQAQLEEEQRRLNEATDILQGMTGTADEN